jgi:serine/threonine protein kinase
MQYIIIIILVVEVLVISALSCIGFYDPSAARNMLKECSKMYHFKHPNVLTLCGVCLDGGPAPYIIMPFMANGSLLAYLKKNKGTLIVSCDDDDDNGEVP